jgi:hypothetical protein
MTDFERVRALFPVPLPCGVWVPLQNGFEGFITVRGAYRLRKRVTVAGRVKFDLYTLTRKGGLKLDCTVSAD